jgi:hypothetical protein
MPAAFAFCSSSQPLFVAATAGAPASGFARALIAIPQYAIAHSGSASPITAKAFGACGNQNECSIAIARLNGCC